VDTAAFDRLIDQLRTVETRSEIILEEVPAPQKLAKFSFAFSADVSNGLIGDAEDGVGSGRFVLLHEPGGQDTWESEFRCVTFMSADVEPDMHEDPMLPEVGWSWFLDSLADAGCEYAAPSGTVTRVNSSSFGKLTGRDNEAEIEIRASWSPLINSELEMFNHVQAWCNLLSTVAGLPPIPDGVSVITPARSRRTS
jgi:Protein of unknown function (DUF3000)